MLSRAPASFSLVFLCTSRSGINFTATNHANGSATRPDEFPSKQFETGMQALAKGGFYPIAKLCRTA
jgi:hypothetical protein